MPEIPRHSAFIPGDPHTHEPWHINSQTVLRAGILGAIAIALFAFLAIRLWALQIISGNEYLRIAQDNQVRTVRLQASRGTIEAQDGTILVENRLTNSVLVWYAELPGAGDKPTRYEVLSHLARVLEMPARKLIREVEQRKTDPLNPITADEDVSQWQSDYILERSDQFPGVEISPHYVRYYPRPWLASLSQVLGYVGSATQAEINGDKTGEIQPNDIVGQLGVELAFDQYLRGEAGLASQRIDSLGHPRSALVPNPEPQPGDTVRLTIKPDLQWAAQQALLHGIQTARNERCDGCWNANGGAIVALDANNGAVLAMATYPTYPASVYSGHVTMSKLARWGLTNATAESKNYPAINRATSGLYPPGSTFKPVTAMAAMASGVLDPTVPLHCTGQIKTPDGRIWHNWDPNANSMINLPTALAISCDTYFYQLGSWIFGLPKQLGEPIQSWALKFGLGQHTKIEIGDSAGVVPTLAWQIAAHPGNTGLQTWTLGDSLNLSIGQKDLQVTPLQMAQLYAGIATGMRVYPHLLYQITSGGKVIDAGVPPAPTPIATGSVFTDRLNVIREGLDLATHDPSGTSEAVFGNFPVRIAGKTGTAEKYVPKYKRNFNQAWWCGYGPEVRPEIVVCAVIENGGHGGVSAAPAAREVFQAYFHLPKSSYQTPTKTD